MVVEASQEGMKIADQLMEGQSSNSSVLSDLEKQREELVQSVKELKTKLRDVHECQVSRAFGCLDRPEEAGMGC